MTPAPLPPLGSLNHGYAPGSGLLGKRLQWVATCVCVCVRVYVQTFPFPLNLEGGTVLRWGRRPASPPLARGVLAEPRTHNKQHQRQQQEMLCTRSPRLGLERNLVGCGWDVKKFIYRFLRPRWKATSDTHTHSDHQIIETGGY